MWYIHWGGRKFVGTVRLGYLELANAWIRVGGTHSSMKYFSSAHSLKGISFFAAIFSTAFASSFSSVPSSSVIQIPVILGLQSSFPSSSEYESRMWLTTSATTPTRISRPDPHSRPSSCCFKSHTPWPMNFALCGPVRHTLAILLRASGYGLCSEDEERKPEVSICLGGKTYTGRKWVNGAPPCSDVKESSRLLRFALDGELVVLVLFACCAAQWNAGLSDRRMSRRRM
jgi:hypothetical protein